MILLTAHDTTCYRPNANGTIDGTYSSYFTPNTNTNYSPCCFSTATYITDNVCYQENHTQGSGFYLALCTDPTYSDSSCPKACSSYTKGDIVFTNNQWLCCGVNSDGSPACSNPTEEVVSGLPDLNSMKALLASATGSPSSAATSSTVSSTTVQTSSTSSLSATPSSSSSQQAATTSGGLTTAAKAGVGAGVAVLVILALLVAFLLVRRKRHRQIGQQSLQSNEKVNLTAPHKYHSEMDSAAPPLYHEGDKKAQTSEPIELMSPLPQQQQRIHEMG